MLATLEAVARYNPLQRLTLTAGPGVTFANRTYMQTFFGIDALQSQRSGYVQFAPRAGVAAAVRAVCRL
jgi:outer membrane protein